MAMHQPTQSASPKGIETTGRHRPEGAALRLPPSAFTLIEMMVVITIMLMLVAAAATMLRPDVEGRKIREAARQLNVYLSSARNRAMETGQECGVTFPFAGTTTNMAFATTLDQCETPAWSPCYCGMAETSVVSVTRVNNELTMDCLMGTLPEHLPNFIAPGDKIQLNHQGPIYTILTITTTGGGGSRITCHTGGRLTPWSATARLVPYRIVRSPVSQTSLVKGVAQPLQLPAATVIDFSSAFPIWTATTYMAGNVVIYEPTGEACVSLYNNNNTTPTDLTNWARVTDVSLTFAPNGSSYNLCVRSVDNTGTPHISYQTPIDPIYFLIGKRERMLNPVLGQLPPTSQNEDKWANWQDGGNLWVVVNPQTGMVTSESILPAQTTVNDSRQLARERQGMGGK